MDNQPITERLLTEYSLLHLQHWIYTKEIAVISAYREVLENVTSKTCKQALQIGHKFTPDENAKRTTLLRALRCYPAIVMALHSSARNTSSKWAQARMHLFRSNRYWL